jgi:ubiquinone/menaquinone biosynthesis C-methylase UbiE
MKEQEELTPFDVIGKAYDESFTQRSAQIAAGAWVVERTGPRARVLDLGCGAGWPTAKQLADEGLDVVGVDVSRTMLDLAAERVPSAQLIQADMRTLPEDIGRFDAVTAFFSLLMLSRHDIVEVLHTCYSLLQRGGVLAIAMVDGDHDAEPGTFFDVEMTTTAYPPQQLVDVVQEAGFTVEAVESHEVTVTEGVVENHTFLRASAEAEA